MLITPMIKLPKPVNPRGFEYILREYCKETFGGLDQIYLKEDQKRDNIDILTTRPDGTRVYVLCRNYRNTKITVSDINDRIIEIDNTKFNMSEAVLATSIFKPDPKLQEHVYQISDDRVSKGLCPVNIIFWNDIEYFVHNHPGMLERYWPQIAEKLEERSTENASIPTVSAADINTGYGLKNLFSEIYKRYHIEDYLCKDPFDGFSFEDLLIADFFMETLQIIEDSAIYAKESMCYKQIIQFEAAFNDYNDYLSTICGISNTGKIAFLPPFTDYNLHEYIDNVGRLKYRVYQCLANIKNDE